MTALILVSMIVIGAYVCRVDILSWSRQPVQMFAHLIGGCCALYVWWAASYGTAMGWHVILLMASGLFIVFTFSRMPSTEEPCSIRDLVDEELRRVAGGSDK